MTKPTGLSPAQEKVLRLRGIGLTHKQVAYDLGLSEQTIKNHETAIHTLLDVTNTIAALHAVGWVHVPDGPLPVERPYMRCEFVARCGRPLDHRGHHGGFRQVPRGGE